MISRPGDTLPAQGQRRVKVALDQHAFVRLIGRAGATVACVSGTLWITRDGCWHDVMLEPGQIYRVEDDTRVLVCGLGPCVAWVSLPPGATGLGRRLTAAAIAAWRQVRGLASAQCARSGPSGRHGVSGPAGVSGASASRS